MNRSRPLPRASRLPETVWVQASAARRRLLLLDFDGTLAPFHAQRDLARPLPSVLRALAGLSRSDRSSVYIVSGRPVAELRERLYGLPLRLVGEHGWEEWSADGGLQVHPVPESSARALVLAVAEAERLGLEPWLETKRASVVLHTRGLPPPRARALETACKAAWIERPELALLRLDAINGGLELRADQRDKGRVVRELIERSGPGTWAVYLGDDRTDEDAFREVADVGLGVRIGQSDAPTAARARLESCEAVADFLMEWLQRFDDGGSVAGMPPE